MQQARELYRSAIAHAPSMPHTYTAWALMEASLRNYDRARQIFKQGAEASPGHAPLLHVRSWGGADMQLFLLEGRISGSWVSCFAYFVMYSRVLAELFNPCLPVPLPASPRPGPSWSRSWAG